MRWASLIIIILTFTIISSEILSVFDLYEIVKNTINTANHDSNSKLYEEVIDLTKIKFDSYLKDFNKNYDNEEYERRFDNFKASLREIAILNALEKNTVFGLTKFSDMSKEEFTEQLLQPYIPPCYTMEKKCDPKPTTAEQNIHRDNVPPGSFDWRQEGVVKPVLNQKLCQGCWAFSIIGVLESMSAIQLKDYRSRSIQELLDCSSYNNGCVGGNVFKAVNFMCDKNLHIVTEKDYPMTLSMDQTCKLPTTGYVGRRITEFKHTCDMDEDEMVYQIANYGPLIVAVDSCNWQNYIGGIITRACTRGVSNHVVQIVGYKKADAQNRIPYYIVRNSFGVDWGDKGYVKVAMKHDNISDICGIAEQVTTISLL